MTLSRSGPKFTKSRGEFNDFTPNSAVSEEELEPVTKETGEGRAVEIIPASGSTKGLREVSATAKVGDNVRRITITFEIPAEAVRISNGPRAGRVMARPQTHVNPLAIELRRDALANGRKLPKLLFVTHRPGLENNLGRLEAQAAVDMVRSAGQTVLEVRSATNPFPEIRSELAGLQRSCHIRWLRCSPRDSTRRVASKLENSGGGN